MVQQDHPTLEAYDRHSINPGCVAGFGGDGDLRLRQARNNHEAASGSAQSPAAHRI
jgi:hypothetical protein